MNLARPNTIHVADLNHPAIEPYRELRNRNWTQSSGRFIAEGPLVVERLLESDYRVESVLIDRKTIDQHLHKIPEQVPVVVVDHTMVEQIVGFNFHRGVLACGRRPAPKVLNELTDVGDANETLIALIGIQDPENVGGILRSASGFGIRRAIIGPGTADPLSRRALRVSMGNSLRLEFLLSREIVADLIRLKQFGIETIATTLEEQSEPLELSQRSGRVLILFGNERYGLPSEILSHVNRRVRIDMALDTDSLNVSAAAAVAMYHFCRIASL